MKKMYAWLLLIAFLATPAYANKLSQLPSGGTVNSSTDQLVAVRSGTSTTSNIIATGTQTFTTQSGLGFVPNQLITAFNSGTNYMQGTVTSYSGTTLVMNASSVAGSGTYASWTLYGDFQVSASGLGTVTTTGSPATGNLTKFSGGSAITNGDLSGDATTNGTLAVTVTKTNGVAFATSATTDTTNASNIFSGTLGAARLPTPTSGSLGGTQSIAAVAHNFLTSISTSGVPTQAQPAASDISGLAASATTDTTNASNINSGTLPAGRMPNPSATTLGGIESTTGAAHNFITSISTSGIPALAQPACGDLSNSGTGCSAAAGYVNNISVVTTSASAGSAANTNYYIMANCASACTITIPTAVANTDLYTVKRTGSATVTVAFTSGQTADGSSAVYENVQYQSYSFISDNANFNIIN